MEELDRLFQPPLLPQSRRVQDPRVPPVLRPHPCEHDGGCVCESERGGAGAGSGHNWV